MYVEILKANGAVQATLELEAPAGFERAAAAAEAACLPPSLWLIGAAGSALAGQVFQGTCPAAVAVAV